MLKIRYENAVWFQYVFMIHPKLFLHKCTVKFRPKSKKVTLFLCIIRLYIWTITAQKLKFSIKDFFSKCDQIRSFLRIWSYLLRKSLMENFILVKCIKDLGVKKNDAIYQINFTKKRDRSGYERS